MWSCKRTSGRRLLLITDDPHIRVGSNLYSSNSVNYFFFSLGAYFKNFRVSCPVMKGTQLDSRFPHSIDALRGDQISERPYYFHKKEILTQPFKMASSVFFLVRDILWADVILFRLPSPFLAVVSTISMVLRKNLQLYIAGDLFGRNKPHHHGLKGRIKGFLVRFYDRLERHAAKKFPCIATGKELSEKYNCEIFFTTLIGKDDIRSKLPEINPLKFKLLFVGRLDQNKGVDNLIKALVIIRNQGFKGAELIIVGTGPAEKNLKELTAKLDLNEHVLFVGSVPFGASLFPWFEQADIFILPSYSEGIPKVLFEAMAMGLPIIATDVGGVSYITDGGRSALLIRPGSPEAIATAVQRLVADDLYRQSLVRNAYAKVKEYTFEERLAHLIGILSRF